MLIRNPSRYKRKGTGGLLLPSPAIINMIDILFGCYNFIFLIVVIKLFN